MYPVYFDALPPGAVVLIVPPPTPKLLTKFDASPVFWTLVKFGDPYIKVSKSSTFRMKESNHIHILRRIELTKVVCLSTDDMLSTLSSIRYLV